MSDQPTFKVLLIGDSGVGKSCILTRFSEDIFSHAFFNTIGVDFRLKQMKVGQRRIKLQLWDTAGQDRFRTITNNYYRGANGIILVYDITDRDSFNNVKVWYSEMSKNAKDNVIKVLVGNKLDLESHRKVMFSQGLEMAQQYGLSFIETSAKSSTNINNLFQDLAINMIEAQQNDPDLKNRIRLKPPKISMDKPIESSSCCC